MEKIKFKQLSVWLKISIICGWIFAIEFIIAFIYGFIIGMGL